MAKKSLMGNVKKFKQTNTPRQSEEVARLRVIQGPDTGTIFILSGSKALIGRGEENDIVISDLKASRTHAELSKSSSGTWFIRDLGSANSVLRNGVRVTNVELNQNDLITMGGTILEFIPSDAGTMRLTAPPPNIEEINAKHSSMLAQTQQLKAFGENKKLLLVGGIVAAAVIWLFIDDTGSQKKRLKKNEEQRDLASYLPTAVSHDAVRSAEMFFKIGFREYNSGNYLRAKLQFETALQVSSDHKLATIYLQNCGKRIEEEIKFHLDNGKKSLDAGKLKEAKGHFETVMRLLYKDQSSPSYIEAKEHMTKVMKEMKGES
ncbi:MAG: FHA domain-containing protein [Bdellovibrionota bacterium]